MPACQPDTARRQEGMAHARVGILLHSLEGALLCYREAAQEAMRRLGDHRHPTLIMSGMSMGDMLDDWNRGDMGAIRAKSAVEIAALKAAGADFFVLPDNSAHIALEQPGPDLALPGLHIGEVVAATAQARGHRKVAVLGTRWTMEGPVYRRALDARGIDWAVPDPAVRDEIHRIIMDELCLGRFAARGTAAFVDAIAALARAGCDCAALVCTEIPLIIGDHNSPLPVLDSTRLLARAAIDVALGAAPLPTWRGGPVRDS